MKHFFSLLLVYVWFFTAPLGAYATDHDFIAQLDEMDIPSAHKNYIKRILFKMEDQCLRRGDLEFELNPFAISRLLISDNGTRATIFSPLVYCEKLDLWNSTTGKRTYILVADKVFESWLMAPPARLILDNALALVLSLDSSQCGFMSDNVSSGAVETCYSILRWNPEAQSFHGVKIQ